MSLFDRITSCVEKARDETGDLARTTRVKAEIGKFNTRKGEFLGEIGRHAHALSGQGKSVPEVEALRREVRTIEDRVAQMEAERARIQRED